MIAEIFKEIFGEDAFKALDERFEKLSKEMDEKDCDRSYFHSVSDKYENGEHVSHKEKEVKDGKVIKDVGFGVGIEDKSKNEKYTFKEEMLKKANETIEKLEKENSEKDEIIENLTKKIKDITTFLQNMNAYMVNNKQIFE